MRPFTGIAALLRVALMSTLQYRSNFVISFVIGACNIVGVVAPIWFLFGHTEKLAGWTQSEATLVVAFFMAMSGVVGAIFEPNLGAVVEGVRSGTLDFVLIKPLDSQWMASIRQVDPTRFWDLVGALLLLFQALPGLPVPTGVQIGTALVLFFSGMAAMYSLYLLVTCTSFWFVRVDNLRYLLMSATDAGRWPVSVYRGWIRGLLTVVLPVAVVTSYPVLALVGKLEEGMAAQALMVGVGALIFSRWAWLRAIRYYSSASS